jgi:hypothetical protein
VQLDQPVPSSLHSRVEPDSLEVTEKLAEVAVVVVAGPAVIDVSGGVVSTGGGGGGGDVTAQSYSAGVASTLPAASLARTENWWAAALKPE